ncbi:MAG TPA: cupredoxin domain-containing protein [Acidimicrobiales bacterium]|nr:cupredoxin domain-containing protein [Acidimicrobiales bacterium]
MGARTQQLDDERRRRRRATITWLGVAAVVALAAVGAALVFGDDDEGGGGSGSPTAAMSISMVEMAFEPDPIQVTVDDAVLRIVNDGAVDHSMLIPELGKGTPDLKPGQELTLDLTQLDPGEYYVYCDIPGHREAGMETTLVLSEG